MTALENFSKIDRENRLLLKKISNILERKENQFLAKHQTPKHMKSLNRSFRKKELKRITQENYRILKRLQTSNAMYSKNDWKKSRKKQEELVRRIGEYDYILDNRTTVKNLDSKASQKNQLVVLDLKAQSTYLK